MKVILLIIAPFIIYAQGSWVDTYVPLLPDDRYDDFFFINEKTGWTLRSYGLTQDSSVIEVYNTNDGLHWTQLNKIYGKSGARSIEFYNEQIGFIGTLDSTILKTEDGGFTWIDISDRIDSNFRGICGLHIQDSIVYGVGTWFGPPVFLRSDDLGQTWTYKNLDTVADALVDVYFFTPDTGIVCGSTLHGPGIILQTNDGGQSWKRNLIADTSNVIGDYVWKIFPLNDTTIFASVQNFYNRPPLSIFKSTNRGNTWTAIVIDTADSPIYMLQGVGFLNENVGWAGGWGPGYYETLNGGSTWTWKPEGGNFNRFQKINDHLIYAAGTSIYFYSDSIFSSIPEKSYSPKDFISAIHPNPSKDKTFISIHIKDHTFAELSAYNSEGRIMRKIISQYLDGGDYVYELSANDLPSGAYVINLYTNDSCDSKKYLVSK